MRIEKDALGTQEIPNDAYWGIHTFRSLQNFQISGVKEPPEMVTALVMVKKAAAMTHKELGLLKAEIADAIVKAADDILAGNLRDQFVVDVFHMGAGTSFNMNVNEVLANRAIEMLGGKKGEYTRVHPNDDVNMGQSTNDVFPTAMRVACRSKMEGLFTALKELVEIFEDKGKEFYGIVKAGRTHLQDAVPIRLGQEFTAYARALEKCLASLHQSATGLEELGVGGTAVGTGLNAHPQLRFGVVQRLAEWTGIAFRSAVDLREAMQSQRPVAEASASLRNLALELLRIANDLRLLSSGPRTGFGEIQLPAVIPGSSIMPGKVNPSIPEMLNMVCFQAVGNDLTIAMAVQAGQLELNVMMPVMAYNLLFSLQILTNAIKVFAEKCVAGITADEEQCRRYAESTLALSTVLNPYIGYAKSAEITKEALATGKSILTLLREKNLLPEEILQKLFQP